MASSPPVPQYRSPLGLDLHSFFITFCLDHSLQYLLYTYLKHYRCVHTFPLVFHFYGYSFDGGKLISC